MTRYFSPSGVLLLSLPVLAGLIDLWLEHVPKGVDDGVTLTSWRTRADVPRRQA